MASYSETPLFGLAHVKYNVVILAAGHGSRLRPETDNIPKALVELGGKRAIDHLIVKYQYLADRIVVAGGFCGDLLENYCRGRYPSLQLLFSHEHPSSLSGPGTSLLYALDHVSSRLPTLITFCDYLVEDHFPVDHDCLGVAKPGSPRAVIDTFKTVVRLDDQRVVDLTANPQPELRKDGGFTGLCVLHDTVLLKSIAYTAAASRSARDVDYAFEIIRPYVRQVRTLACPLEHLFEFGTADTLRSTREFLRGNHEPRP